MAGIRKDKMALVAFMQAGNTSVYAGSWRHPATEHHYLDASYYAKIGRQLEEGCFDLMFFDDRLAMPGVYGGSVEEAVHYGARPVKLDLGVVLGVLAQYDVADRARCDLLHHLLRAVPRRQDVRDAGPPFGWAGRMERRHLGQRQ